MIPVAFAYGLVLGFALRGAVHQSTVIREGQLTRNERYEFRLARVWRAFR